MKTRKFFLCAIGAASLFATGCSTSKSTNNVSKPSAVYSLPVEDVESQQFVASKKRPYDFDEKFSDDFDSLKNPGDNFDKKSKTSKASGDKYCVKKNDSIYKIANKLGVSAKELMDINGLNTKSVLQIGQKLDVPGHTSSGKANKQSSNQPKTSINKSSKIATVAPGSIYVIKQGDVLGSIAVAHKTSIAALKAENGLKSDKIFVGQKLRIPGGQAKAAVKQQANPANKANVYTPNSQSVLDSDGLYTIKSGDSIARIAQKLSVKQSDLQSLNGLDASSKLQIGKKLLVPTNSAAKSSINISEPSANVQHSFAQPTAQQVVPSQMSVQPATAPVQQLPSTVIPAAQPAAPVNQDAFFDDFDDIPVIEL